MTNEEKFAYWLDIAQYDLDSAEAMFSTGRWLYVMFMCQQSLEKLVKGLYALYLEKSIPPIHDIRSVFLEIAGKLTVPVEDETVDFFSWLTSFYINTRYPQYKAMLSSAVTRQEAERALKKTKEVFAWLLTLKPSTGSSANTSRT